MKITPPETVVKGRYFPTITGSRGRDRGGGGEGWRIILEIVSRQLCGAGNPAGPCRNFPSNTDIVDRLRYVGTITAYYLFRLIRRGGSKVSMEIRINNTMVAR